MIEERSPRVAGRDDPRAGDSEVALRWRSLDRSGRGEVQRVKQLKLGVASSKRAMAVRQLACKYARARRSTLWR